MIIRYNSDLEEILIRDNRSQSGTFQISKGEALSHRTFYKFQLSEEPIKLAAGDIEVEITKAAPVVYTKTAASFKPGLGKELPANVVQKQQAKVGGGR